MSADARLHREFANLQRENERLRKRLSQLSDLSKRITSSLKVATVLQNIVDAASDLVGSENGVLVVFDESGSIRTFVTHGITSKQQERQQERQQEHQREQPGDLPEGLGLLGLLHQDEKPLRLSDLSSYPSPTGAPPNHPSHLQGSIWAIST